MTLKAGFYQFRPKHLAPDENRNKIAQSLSGIEADLIVLPELAVSGYLFSSRKQPMSVAESGTGGPTAVLLKKIARERNCSIVAGFAELCGEDVYNSAMLVNPDGNVHIYRKVHLFDDEKRWFKPGDEGFKVFTAKDGVRVGLMICFDWIFPESARTLALRGAQIICHPANLVLPWCQQAMTTRSIENRVFTITANRFGAESEAGKELVFTGRSQLTNPRGEILHRAHEQEEELFVTQIEPDQADQKMVTMRNHVHQDRRPEFYER